jgi:hypothetical protein
MFVDVMIRRRAGLEEPVGALNARLLEQLISLPDFWGERKPQGMLRSSKARQLPSI